MKVAGRIVSGKEWRNAARIPGQMIYGALCRGNWCCQKSVEIGNISLNKAVIWWMSA
jgi:hypothetical protein